MNNLFLDMMPIGDIYHYNGFFYSRMTGLFLLMLCFLLFLNLIIGSILLIIKIKKRSVSNGFKGYYITSIIVLILFIILFIISMSKPEESLIPYHNPYENAILEEADN